MVVQGYFLGVHRVHRTRCFFFSILLLPLPASIRLPKRQKVQKGGRRPTERRYSPLVANSDWIMSSAPGQGEFEVQFSPEPEREKRRVYHDDYHI